MDDSRLQSQVLSTAVESGKAMGSALKSEGKDEGLAELYKLNQVWYRMPPTLSLVSKRTITKCQFQQASYGPNLQQQIMAAIFNTGEFYVNAKTSFLVLQAGIDKSSAGATPLFRNFGLVATAALISENKSAAHVYLAQGGIMNIFEEITFLSASGTEVDRQQNKGLQASHVQRNRNSLDWYNTAGEVQGVPGGSFQDCYDKKGWPGVLLAAGPIIIQPYLIPPRTTHGLDQTLQNINLTTAAAVGGIGAATTAYSNPHPEVLPSEIGSVDVSFDSLQEPTYNPVPGQAPIFLIPLCEVLGMFCPYMNALIPSQALAGGRIEFRFKNMVEALTVSAPLIANNAANDGSLYNNANAINNATSLANLMTIYNAYFLLDSFQLNEGTLRRLNEAAAGNEGLSVMFDTWDWTQTQTTTLSFEAQVAQARSRILRSFCVLRDNLMLTHPFANSLASEAAVQRPTANIKLYSLTNAGQQLLVNSYQAQLGSLYFPQQPLSYLEEYVTNSYYMWNKQVPDPMDSNAVAQGDFTGANGIGIFNAGAVQAPIVTSAAQGNAPTDQVRAATYALPNWGLNWGSATYGFLAERSQLLQLSGLPISNARLLRHRFNVNYLVASTTSRVVDVFTEYTRVMKVFLGGRIVMRE